MKPFWLSWYYHSEFEYHGPWWVSGCRLLDGDATQDTICAAVMAEDELEAKAEILASHDNVVSPEWRFCEQRPSDWSPFSDRFQRADWMKWPYPEET